MTKYEKPEEATKEDLQREIVRLNKEITRYQIVLDDYGIEESELLEITDSEILCLMEIDKLREMSEIVNGALSKEEADAFKIWNQQLMKIRGGAIKRKQKVAQGKDLSDVELLAEYRKLKAEKSG